jgi:hypothetical protein
MAVVTFFAFLESLSASWFCLGFGADTSPALSQIFLVFTDGQFSKSASFNKDLALQRAVAGLNANNVIVFFFSVGPGEQDNPPDPLTNLRNLSCLMNSSVTYVSEEDAFWNPLWAIRPYFDYQATLRFKENVTFWSEPYIDFDGLGEVSTVAYPGMLLPILKSKISMLLV